MTAMENYKASMVLSGLGDALGYKNGSWEFCHSGKEIHKELKSLGGLSKIHVKLPDWMISDDTVLHIATAKALVNKSESKDKEDLYQELAAQYKEGCRDMSGRAMGACTANSVFKLRPGREKGYHIPFNDRGGGCGAAMRAMCIGLRYPRHEDTDDLVAVSVESGRMTHNHPTGYLGALASACLTACAVRGEPIKQWGQTLMKVVEKAKVYVEADGRDLKDNLKHWNYFVDKWNAYLKHRGIDGDGDPVFTDSDNDMKSRDSFYKSLSFSGWGGSSGHDAPIIAYDALMASGSSWSELCSRSMFHGGDSDSTGVIAGACFGVMYGFQGVPECNYKNLEYGDILSKLGEDLYRLSHKAE